MSPCIFSKTPALAIVFCLLMIPVETRAQEATPSATTDSLRADVRYLASDELRGRSVTDESIHVAARYIAGRMESVGLDTDILNGTPYQSVDTPVGSRVGNQQDNYCRVRLGDESIEAVLEDGFGPLAVGMDSGKASGPLLFVGYGITSQRHDFDDYRGFDATGAVVIILRKEPGASDPDSPFDGVKNTRHAFFATKVVNAIRHGASAVLIVNDPRSTREAVQIVRNKIDQEVRRKKQLEELLEKLPPEAKNNRAATAEKIAGAERLMKSTEVFLKTTGRGVLSVSGAGPKSDDTATVPVASIARDVADRLLMASGTSLEEVEKQINESFRPASRFITGATADVSVDLTPAIATSNNVIGILPGKGALGSQAIVVGAHYDHVGMGGFASLAPGTIAVHNGADDNASGTATMLASAESLTTRLARSESHRTVIFIAFTGEERGLVGSARYVKAPVKPLAQTAAMINLDMVGRLRDNELTIYGTGSATGLDALVEEANRDFGFNLFKVASGYGPSDHQSFYREGVPVLFFFTGLHNDYHRPSDDFDKIDFGNLTRVTDMVSQVAFRLATRNERPQYAQTENQVQIRRQMTAYLGIRLSGRVRGAQVVAVTEGGPASKAGLQTGDIIERIGRKEIRSTSDVLNWVRDHSPGDSFEIRVVRNSILTTLRGKLEKRPE